MKKSQRFLYFLQKKAHRLFVPRASEKSVLFIVGCQRSGTTVMRRILETDLNSKTYGEYSKLSSNGIRWRSLEWVKNEFDKEKAPFIVSKPLVESQNVPAILDYFPVGRNRAALVLRSPIRVDYAQRDATRARLRADAPRPRGCVNARCNYSQDRLYCVTTRTWTGTSKR